jgi:hypothetical protein
MTTDRTHGEKPGSAKGPIEELTSRAGLPVRHFAQRVVLSIGGKRFEVRHRAEVRELPNGPARVIEMPRRPPEEP